MNPDTGSSWHSYPKIYAIGHRQVADLFKDPVIVEEKVDGSQLSFGVFDGEIRIRSRGRVFDINAADSMFEKAATTVTLLCHELHDGWTYRGEYLNKPKHNSLTYNRTPAQNFILFDVETGLSAFLDGPEKLAEANRLGLECVPMYHAGTITDWESLKLFLDRESCLGGPKVEGFVVKNYNRFAPDGHPLMGKYVSEAFKEIHSKEWKKSNPGGKDVIGELVERHRTEARWAKAVQHLRETGDLLGDPRDIGPLLKELNVDFEAECVDDVKDYLYRWASKNIKRGICRGFPEWYKEQLAQSAFGDGS